MKPERAFIAERMLARHCPELLPADPRQTAPAGDPLARLALFAARLGQALVPMLAPLLGGDDLMVEPAEPHETDPAALAMALGPLAASNAFSSEEGLHLIVSLPAAPVLRMVDRAFGGRGKAPDPLPDAFPLSAELMIARLGGIIAVALGESGAALRHAGPAEQPPFAEGTRLAAIDLTAREANGAAWTIRLALPCAALGGLLGQDESKPALPPAIPRHPADAPFGDLPLPVSAVLVDMQLAVSALAQLRAGQVLPVAVARSVPLTIDGHEVARGTIGELDDRVAIQITSAFQNSQNGQNFQN